MAKTPTTKEAPATDQAGLPVEPTTGETTIDPPAEPEVPEMELSTYEQALAFKPDPWDQLPDDLEVRSIYLALNGHINFFIKRRA
jgi:hypothetical protein